MSHRGSVRKGFDLTMTIRVLAENKCGQKRSAALILLGCGCRMVGLGLGPSWLVMPIGRLRKSFGREGRFEVEERVRARSGGREVSTDDCTAKRGEVG
jgi:hypothetical protein